MLDRMCPVCRATMRATDLQGVVVDGCPRCGGVWLDYAELQRLAQKGAPALAEAEAAFSAAPQSHGGGWRRRCPVCGVPLREFEFSNLAGLRLDGCDQCKGIWADEGEMAELARRLTGGSSP